jgi:trehalose/maltose hydrolase-like predicted phosphorylase
VPFHGDGVISQFEGYGDLEELDWDGYRSKYGNIQRLDRILRAEGEDPNRFKAAKQADTVMLHFLFPDADLQRLIKQLGYDYGPETARRTIEYYDRRTSHGSTLSLIVHAGVLAAIDPERSWERFLAALDSDLADIQGGTTPEGIHLGVMAGTIDVMQRIYLGTEIRDGALHFTPRLIDRLDGLTFPITFRDTAVRVKIEGCELTVAALSDGRSPPIRVGVAEQSVELGPGDRATFSLTRLRA